MKEITTSSEDSLSLEKPFNRRDFLRYAGFTAAAAGLLLSSCKKDQPAIPEAYTGVNLGSGDTGVLNYAYALEQLEAAFYTQVVSTPFSGITTEEGQIMEDLQKHEVAHREFFKAVLGSNAIPALEPNFSSVDFSSRASVLATAKAFEDLGVSAYNGAGKLLTNADYLLIAGKIVSVEARHAAAVRDLLNPNSMDFAGDDIINSMGLGLARTPAEVLAIASAFIKTPIDASNLPTS